MTFKESLIQGQIAESEIANYLKSRGCVILPVYEKEVGDFKGPQVFTLEGEYVAPDMLAFKGGDSFFIECKSKTRFCWNRKHQIWTTGINKRHWLDYLHVKQITNCPVWLLFLQSKSLSDKGTVKSCPTGLFGGELSHLDKKLHHEWPSKGKQPAMVYWNHADLKLISTLENFYASAEDAA